MLDLCRLLASRGSLVSGSLHVCLLFVLTAFVDSSQQTCSGVYVTRYFWHWKGIFVRKFVGRMCRNHADAAKRRLRVDEGRTCYGRKCRNLSGADGKDITVWVPPAGSLCKCRLEAAVCGLPLFVGHVLAKYSSCSLKPLFGAMAPDKNGWTRDLAKGAERESESQGAQGWSGSLPEIHSQTCRPGGRSPMPKHPKASSLNA